MLVGLAGTRVGDLVVEPAWLQDLREKGILATLTCRSVVFMKISPRTKATKMGGNRPRNKKRMRRGNK